MKNMDVMIKSKTSGKTREKLDVIVIRNPIILRKRTDKKKHRIDKGGVIYNIGSISI